MPEQKPVSPRRIERSLHALVVILVATLRIAERIAARCDRYR